ncbi:metastasis-suppressor KiSS-1 [Canis aureus]|uniref:Kisspeptin n=2 Tax=Canis lupus familiaris TaxID=9615 RepID=A0A8C0MYT7_CANLF|nr:kisspeptin precursor [Canis lupus familiaris]|eukprot:XP_013966762.1 metastasis-suppressor KiSS-1 [Canis lupus familiaris]
MNSLVSWQLMLLLCATSFRETLEKVAPMETPGPAGQRLGAQALPAPWERSPPRAPQRHLMPARRGADLPAYNWNVFGLRYGRRRAATPGLRGGTPSPRLRVPVGWGLGLRS